jgi:predicted lipoprotein with Yx(FWY)xxD motif
MRCTRTSPVPLAVTGLALLTATVACTAGGSPYSSSSPGGAGAMVMQQQTAPVTPGLFSDRPFDLSPMVVDEMGMTVYRYDKDSPNPSRSTCDGDCARQWKPIRPSADLELGGIDKSAISSVTRPDGSDQVTLAGWPLYRFAGDGMAGETAGQGKDGAWYPIAPTGEKVQAVSDPGQSSAFGF